MTQRLSVRFNKIKTTYYLHKPGFSSLTCLNNNDNNDNNNNDTNGETNPNDEQSDKLKGGKKTVDEKSANNNTQQQQLMNMSQEIDTNSIASHMPQELPEILRELDHYTLDWRRHAIDCLKLISESTNCTNIIITRMPLVVALGHLICLGFSPFFDIDQVYSASKSSKEACIRRVKKRFGATNRCSYIIVGDKEDADMARRLDLPCWSTTRSDGHTQLVQLYTALKEGYLM